MSFPIFSKTLIFFCNSPSVSSPPALPPSQPEVAAEGFLGKLGMVHVTKTETILKKIQKCSPNCLLSNSFWCLCDRLELELSPTSQLFPIPRHMSPRAYPISILSLPPSSSPCAPRLCLWPQRTPWCHVPNRAWHTMVLLVGPDIPLHAWQR